MTVSDGFIVNLIKYPELSFNRKLASHPFLSQLIAACDDLLHRITVGDNGSGTLFRTQSVESVNTDSLAKNKSAISSGLKSLRNKFLKIRKPKGKSTPLKLQEHSLKYICTFINVICISSFCR